MREAENVAEMPGCRHCGASLHALKENVRHTVVGKMTGGVSF